MAEPTQEQIEKAKRNLDKERKTTAERPAERERKVYDHELTKSEEFAVQTLQKTRNAITAVIEHIREGKGCNGEMIAMAIGTQRSAAALLFGPLE